MTQRFLPSLLLGPLFIASLAACGDDGGGPGTIDVSLQFTAEVDGAAFACGDEYVLGANATTLRAEDFRFFVHDVRLIDAGGVEVPVVLEQDGTWQVDDVALLDFEDGCGEIGNARTRDVVTGTAPAGDYDGVRFTVGVPFDGNHQDPVAAPPPLNETAMHWNWLGGYKFIRFDGTYPDVDGGWFLHLGSTVCMNDDGQTFPSMDFDPGSVPTGPCQNPNMMEDVDLDGFDPLTGTVVADLGAVLASSAIDENDGRAVGCQSAPPDTDCSEVFPLLGLPHSGNPADAQALFTAR